MGPPQKGSIRPYHGASSRSHYKRRPVSQCPDRRRQGVGGGGGGGFLRLGLTINQSEIALYRQTK